MLQMKLANRECVSAPMKRWRETTLRGETSAERSPRASCSGQAKASGVIRGNGNALSRHRAASHGEGKPESWRDRFPKPLRAGRRTPSARLLAAILAHLRHELGPTIVCAVLWLVAHCLLRFAVGFVCCSSLASRFTARSPAALAACLRLAGREPTNTSELPYFCSASSLARRRKVTRPICCTSAIPLVTQASSFYAIVLCVIALFTGVE